MIDILIVEDDKELAGLLTDFLRDEGYTTSSVDSGERAMQLFERYGARLVVLDINLPDVNGFAVCSKLRENADTPILIIFKSLMTLIFLSLRSRGYSNGGISVIHCQRTV